MKSQITLWLVVACTFLFLLGAAESPRVREVPTTLPATPFVASPVRKALMFDYPKEYTLIDLFLKKYTIEGMKAPMQLPPEGIQLLYYIDKTPAWQGILGSPESKKASLFEKERQGQIYRFITPIFLHADILHLLFNMGWLLMLGRPIEERVGPTRYLILIALIAAFSNTAQYLMTGPNFLGFSGVICGMLTYTRVRQWKAPWERYPLQESTYRFLMLFIIGMAGFEGLMMLFHTSGIGLANTAHLAGAAIGALLGLIPKLGAPRVQLI